MNILFLSRLHRPHIGGIEKHVEKISQILLKKGHQVSIIAEKHKNNLKDFEIINGINIYRIPLKNSPDKQKKFAIWKYIWMYRDLIKNADIVHVHDVIYWLFPFPFSSKNLFITYHGYEGSRAPKLSSIIQRKIGEWMAKGTINIGGFMKSWHHSNPDKILYGATDRIEPSKTKNKKAIYIGRLHEDTGIMTYLQALKILKEKGKSISLDVFGSGPQEKIAKKYARDHQLSVKFKGFVVNAQKYLPKYSYAFVSRYLTILEAFSAKVPIYAAYNNQIKKDYIYCHPMSKYMHVFKNPKHLVSALQKPQKNNEDSFQWAASQSWESLVSEYEDLWWGQK